MSRSALGSAGGWRVAARLARREVRRRPGRTALVVALVAVPVAGMLLGVAYLRTQELSNVEHWHFEHGRADAVLYRDTAVAPPQLPEGSRTVDYVTMWRVVGTADGDLCRCGLSDLPFEDLTDGIVQVTSGRPPAAADEVLLSEQAASALRTGLGERVELTRPVELSATVVGIGYPSTSWQDPIVVIAPGAAGPLADPVYAASERLVDLPDDMTPDEVLAWEEQAGPHALSPAYPWRLSTEMSGDNANTPVRWTWMAGAIGLTVLGIVIAAAFAAGARRQLVTLGQLATNGGTPALLRRVLFLQGTVTGLIGSLAGLALGGLVLALARPYAPPLLGRAVPHWDVRLLDVLPVVLIAVVAATVAALVPAVGASRVSVLTALAGRRPLGRVSSRRTTIGLALTAVGVALLAFAAYVGRGGMINRTQMGATACAVAGPVLLLLGVCTATPAYVTVLRPVARALRGPWRLAARSLFRQRTRTSAMVSAICAISAVAVAAAALGLAVEHKDRAVVDMPDDVVRVQSSTVVDDATYAVASPEALMEAARQVEAALPDAERYDLAHAVDPAQRIEPSFGPPDFVPADPDEPGDAEAAPVPQQATIVDAEFRRAYHVDAATRQLLDELGAVWMGPAVGRVTVDATLRETMRSFTFTAGVLGPEHAHGFGSMGELLLTPERAEELGLVAAPAEVVLRTREPLTEAQRDAVDRVSLQFEMAGEDAALTAADPSAPPEPTAWVELYRPSLQATPGLIETVPASIALLFGLFVVAVGLALAAVETRDERDVLAVLGAPPRTLRRASGYKAFLLTLLGGLVAVPVGLVPVLVVTRITEDGLPAVVPWRTIALIVVAVPLVTAAVTATASRLALRHRPPQVSTATFT